MRDLVLTGGRIIDPATGRDETADIAFGDGKVAEIGRDLPTRDVRDASEIPGSRAAVLEVRIHLPPAVSPANFDIARAGHGYRPGILFEERDGRE